jgi:hypothetical protein
LMIWLVGYLYVIGATMMWWFARSTDKPMAAKVIASIGWPVVVPVAALWG